MSAARRPEVLTFPGFTLPVEETADWRLVKIWLRRFQSNATRAAYEHEARRFLAAVALPLVELTEVEQLAAWEDQLEGLADSSRRRAFAAIRSLLKLGFGLGRLSCNLALALVIPGRGKKLPHIVSRAAIVAALEAVKDPLQRIVLRGYYLLGMRVSEFTGATWGDLSHSGGRWWLRVVGKGDRERDIPLSKDYSALLLELRPEGFEPSQKIVCRSRQTIWRWVKAMGKSAGYPDLSPHWLRHCCASHLLDAKIPPHEVQELLGHASLATTTAYANVQPEANPSEALEF